MKTWLRRLLYLLIVLVWLMIMAFPIVAFRLATNGEIAWGQETGRQGRLFLLQDAEAEGVGLQSSRPQSGASACVITTVRYFMWAGEGQNTRSCYCTDGTLCQEVE
jgi:hypothetical protein